MNAQVVSKRNKKKIWPTIFFSRGHPVCGVKMVAIALRVEMKLRGRFTTYPKNRKPKEMLLRYYVSLQLYCSKRVIYTSKRIKKGN